MRRVAAVAVAVAVVVPTVARAQFGSPSYATSQVFLDGLGGTSMTMAFDGTSYWSTSGGGTFGTRLAQYDAAGNLLNTYTPGLDFRSIFTNSSGDVFARQFASSTIYKMTSPGVFQAVTTLLGASIDAQSSVVLSGDGTKYLAESGGAVNQWALDGTFLGATALAGFGSMNGEANYPQGRGIAAVGNYWLTYANQTLSLWDEATGNRLGTTTLEGSGTSFDANFSLSYANDKAWVVDVAGGDWRGYDVGLSAPVTATPEPASLALMATGLAGVGGFVRRRRRHAISA